MNYFSQKILVWGKWTILGLILGSKMAHTHNSGSTLRIFSKFCTMKGANRFIEIMLMAFPKKILFQANGPFRTQIGTPSQLWICHQHCFTILHNGRGQQRHGNYINVFSKTKSYLGDFGHFGQKMV